MRTLSPDHASELVAIDLYRLQTETLARHAALAVSVGENLVAEEYLAEIARREAQTEMELAA